MMLHDPNELDYLHDADVLRVVWDASEPGTRTVVMEVRCHPDAGHPRWNGRALRITAKKVAMFRQTAWGYSSGGEEINLWSQGVSDATESELKRLADIIGLRPRLLLTVTFQSGSSIEFACDSLSVEDMEVA